MAGQYSPKQFFRKVSNKFLIDYIERKNIVFDLDLYAIYDHEVELIFNSFIKLDEVTRHAMESDFQRVHALATDGGIVALTDEAREFDNYNFIETIQSQSPEEFKAWSQNLGHAGVLTTLYSYGDVPDYRQAELIKKLSQPRAEQSPDMQAAIEATIKKMMGKD